jgi:hypothetical protein
MTPALGGDRLRLGSQLFDGEPIQQGRVVVTMITARSSKRQIAIAKSPRAKDRDGFDFAAVPRRAGQLRLGAFTFRGPAHIRRDKTREESSR